MYIFLYVYASGGKTVLANVFGYACLHMGVEGKVITFYDFAKPRACVACDALNSGVAGGGNNVL